MYNIIHIQTFDTIYIEFNIKIYFLFLISSTKRLQFTLNRFNFDSKSTQFTLNLAFSIKIYSLLFLQIQSKFRKIFIPSTSFEDIALLLFSKSKLYTRIYSIILSIYESIQILRFTNIQISRLFSISISFSSKQDYKLNIVYLYCVQSTIDWSVCCVSVCEFGGIYAHISGYSHFWQHRQNGFSVHSFFVIFNELY